MSTKREPSLVERLRLIAESLAEQQAMPDDSWKEQWDAALRATPVPEEPPTGEGALIGVDWAAPGHDQTVQAELPHPVAWPESHGSIAAPPPPLREQAMPASDDKSPDAGAVVLQDEWQEAYKAFKGAFDTPLAWKRQSDEFAEDARKRLAAFNESFSAHPAPAQVDGWKLVIAPDRDGQVGVWAVKGDSRVWIDALTAAAKEVDRG